MPLFNQPVSNYKPGRPVVADWDNFRKGLNVLLNEVEIGDDELAQADNIVLVGKGAPTKRWGYADYFLAHTTGSVRALGGYYKADGTNQLVSITDAGILTIKSSASYAAKSGASWASGYNQEMVQLNDYMYIVSQTREMVRYNGTSLEGFPTISIPGSVLATQISGATGNNTYGYRVSARTAVGETLASTTVSLTTQPQDLVDGAIKISWTAVSAASGVLKAYNIYGRTEGT